MSHYHYIIVKILLLKQ